MSGADTAGQLRSTSWGLMKKLKAMAEMVIAAPSPPCRSIELEASDPCA